MNDSALRALVEWLRPRPNWKWLVVGDIGREGLDTLIAKVEPALVTVVVNHEEQVVSLSDGLDKRVKVVVDDFTSLRTIATGVDATLDYGALDGAEHPSRMVLAFARTTRLYGLVAAIEKNSVSRRTLWDWWLDARLNDVTSQDIDGYSLVRGTR